MRKGGFNMYLIEKKSSVSLYKNYEPKFSKHKDTEIQAYISHTVGNEISKKMISSINCMTTMIIQGFSKGGN